MIRLTACLVFLIILLPLHSYSQDKAPVKFGEVSAKDFATKFYSVDSNAAAVVIADIGSCALEGNRKGWFSSVNKHYKRVHILNKNGYDIANVSISLYSNGEDEESLDKLRASTYNIEDGKVVETKLDTKASVFEDKLDKKHKIKKFTFPNIKEGSIIEYEYITRSDFIDFLDPWDFQGDYPRLWSEFNFSVPSFFNYTFLTQGYLSFDINTQKNGTSYFNVTFPNGAGASQYTNFTANVTDNRWVVKNAPALKEESFTTTIDNHIQRIKFQLKEWRDPLPYHNFIESWPQVIHSMMESDYFGAPIKKDNGWIKDLVSPLFSTGDSKAVKARKIYSWVRDNFTCTSHHRRSMDQTLKGLVKSRSGSVAEINLLLTAMLRYIDLDADPVILGTRSSGVTYPIYPLLDQYDYVITRLKIDTTITMLDASEPHLGFGYLPLRCYNGGARVINEAMPALVDLSSDGLKEVKNTMVFVINDEKGNIVGSMQQTPGYYESANLRDEIKDKGADQLQKDIKKDFGAEILISNFGIDSLAKYDFPLMLHYDFDIKDEKEDLIYFNPLFGEGYKENPFKSAERKYPVEMPYTMDETYNLQMEVPVGYEVDELPKSMVLKLNEEEEGLFEYRVSLSGSNISLRCRLQLKRAWFQPDEYEMLREFFSMVVKKESEQIVFKKKK